MDNGVNEIKELFLGMENRLYSRFEHVDRRFSEMEERFEQIDKRFEQIDNRFEQIDKRFKQLDERFVRIEDEMKSTSNRINSHESIYEQLINLVGKTNEKVDEIRLEFIGFKRDVLLKFDQLDRSLHVISADINFLHRETSEHRRAIYHLQHQ